ncbi:hypothetical protein ACE1SV_70180 [Streptomyces sennicomposti]
MPPPGRDRAGDSDVRGRPGVEFDGAADAVVLQLPALEPFDGEAGGPAHAAAGRVVDLMPQLRPEEADFLERNSRQARDATPCPRAAARVPYDTPPSGAAGPRSPPRRCRAP